MRDCIFLLADKNMQAVFEGFLTRQAFYQSLGCGSFVFDPRQDIAVASGDNDPGLYIRGHELLRPYQETHRHAVVALDAEWEGSPGKTKIAKHLTAQISATGWMADHFVVIVIDPELESWIWQKNCHVASALGFNGKNEMMDDTDLKAKWPQGQAKPSSPKEILESLLRKNGIPRSSAIYKQIVSQVSVRRCQDLSFQQFIRKLQTWFPQENTDGTTCI